MPVSEMQTGAEPDDSREPFLLEQPIWKAVGTPEQCWALAIREDEPTDDASKGEPAFRPAPDSDETSGGHYERLAPRDENISRDHVGEQLPTSRKELIRLASEGGPKWMRVGVVCGAGLGKTTNLLWLEAAVNALFGGRHRQLAVFLELRDLPGSNAEILDLLARRLGHYVANPFARDDARRFLELGRVTWLLDSIDQADPDPEGPVVAALTNLMTGQYGACPVWVSGRPYAFRIAREALQAALPKASAHGPDATSLTPWQFLRIGQLDEPESRQLLETTRRPGH